MALIWFDSWIYIYIYVYIYVPAIRNLGIGILLSPHVVTCRFSRSVSSSPSMVVSKPGDWRRLPAESSGWLPLYNYRGERRSADAKLSTWKGKQNSVKMQCPGAKIHSDSVKPRQIWEAKRWLESIAEQSKCKAALQCTAWVWPPKLQPLFTKWS